MRNLKWFKEELKAKQKEKEQKMTKLILEGKDGETDEESESERQAKIEELQNMSIEIFDQKQEIGTNYLQQQMGGRDKRNDFLDRMV